MKNLRKILAVVLAVALAFSMMAIASAADITGYTDASSITNKEAVNVLTNAGVLAGNGGVFSPTATFTREQAAKVICYLLLGSSVANTLKASSSSFSDVAATRWSAPFINYCVMKGVINGTGNGTFAPEASVTGSQFAKMLLTAIGYGKLGEYTGANWEINSIVDAQALYILTGSADFTAAATREQVAQYALNALNLKFQSFSTLTNTYSDSGAAVNTFALRLGMIYTASATSNGVLGHQWTWTLTGKLIGFYADETVISNSTSGLPLSLLTDTTSAFYKATLATTYAVYVNGRIAPDITSVTPVINGQYGYDYANKALYKYSAAGAANAAAKAAYGLVAGNVVNFIDTTPVNGYSYADKVSIVVKTIDVIGINGVKTVAGINGNYDSVTVDLTLAGAADITGTTVTVTGYTGLAYLDVVSYYTDSLGVTHIEKATAATGKLSGYSAAYSTVTVGGKVYSLSGEANATNLAFITGLGYVADITVYTDANGYLVYATGQTIAATADKAVLLASGDVDASGISLGYTQAQILLPDGTTKIVVSTQNAAALGGLTTIVSYTVNSSTGAYTFASASTGNAAAATFTKGISNFTGALYGNSATIFIVRGGSAGAYTYTVYTGIANVPTMTGVTYAYYASSGIAALVYVSAASTSVSSANTVFFYSLANSYTAPSALGAGDDYYSYSAVVGATGSQPVKVATGITSILTPGVYTVTYDATGRVNSAAKVVDGTYFEVGTATTAPASSVVGIDGKFFSYAATAPVYYYNTLTYALSTTTVAGIATVAAGGTYAVAAVDAYGQITAVYIMSADPAAALGSATAGLSFAASTLTAVHGATTDFTLIKSGAGAVIGIAGAQAADFTLKTADATNPVYTWANVAAGTYGIDITVTETNFVATTYHIVVTVS